MTILVAGGAGYIGSHTVKELVRSGFDVLVFDNFSSGRKEAVREAFRTKSIAAVLHFASLIQVGESYADPRKYYTHNLQTSLNLFDAMLEADVRSLIFSSSAAIYGPPQETPIPETHPLNPANPYGQTKFMVERILQDYDRAYGLRSISLRYFNAAGADPDGQTGEAHQPETHLIPNILLGLLGRGTRLGVFGNDFPTPDGTAVRDYIHVTDLAAAHILALKALLAGGPTETFNLGTNKGFSVLEVIRKAEQVTGRKVAYDIRPRREGDVAVLLASKEKAERSLGWKPRLSSLETIIETAWDWHKSRKAPSAA